MSLNLPERASYEYLKKLAKERLALLRTRKPATKLADVQLAIAREYGFSSWRALKVEIAPASAERRPVHAGVHGRRREGVARVVEERSGSRLRARRRGQHRTGHAGWDSEIASIAHSGRLSSTTASCTRSSKWSLPWAKGRPLKASNIGWWAGA